jgi:peptidoglycan/LPS O-acetylase OafA/YrhL
VWLFRTTVFILSIGLTVIRFKFYASWLVTENLFAIVLFFWLKNELAYYKFNKSIAFFERLGKFSYSLYLCHPLLFLVFSMYMPLNGFTYPIVVVSVVAMSYVIYLLVEYPSHRLAQKLTKTKTRTTQLSPDVRVK